MSVCYISQFFHPENVGVACWVPEQLARDGWDVRVLTGVPNYPTGVVPAGYDASRASREMVGGLADGPEHAKVPHRSPAGLVGAFENRNLIARRGRRPGVGEADDAAADHGGLAGRIHGLAMEGFTSLVESKRRPSRSKDWISSCPPLTVT